MTNKLKNHVLSVSATANANYPDNTGIDINGGRYEFIASGTSDGATAQLYVKPGRSHASFLAVSGAKYTNEVMGDSKAAPVIEFAHGDTVYCTVTLAGASTDLVLTLNGLDG